MEMCRSSVCRSSSRATDRGGLVRTGRIHDAASTRGLSTRVRPSRPRPRWRSTPRRRPSRRPASRSSASEPASPTSRRPDYIVEAAVEACRDPGTTGTRPPPACPELKEAIAVKTAPRLRRRGRPRPGAWSPTAASTVYSAFSRCSTRATRSSSRRPYWTTYPEPIALAGRARRGAHRRRATGSGSPSTSSRRPARRSDEGPLVRLAVEPDRRGLPARRDRGHRSVGGRARDLGHHRRDLRAPHLRRHTSSPRSLAVVPELADQCVILNGVAKTYAMTGWRVGWLIGPPDVVKAATNLQSHLTSNVSNVAQRAALAAVTVDLSTVDEMRAAFDRRGARSCTRCSTRSTASRASSPRAPSTPTRTSGRARPRASPGETADDHGRAGRSGPRGGQGGDRPRRGVRRRPGTPASRSPSATTTWARASAASPTCWRHGPSDRDRRRRRTGRGRRRSPPTWWSPARSASARCGRRRRPVVVELRPEEGGRVQLVSPHVRRARRRRPARGLLGAAPGSTSTAAGPGGCTTASCSSPTGPTSGCTGSIPTPSRGR